MQRKFDYCKPLALKPNLIPKIRSTSILMKSGALNNLMLFSVLLINLKNFPFANLQPKLAPEIKSIHFKQNSVQ